MRLARDSRRFFSLAAYRPLDARASSLIAMLRGGAALVVLLGHTYQTLLARWAPGVYPYAGLLSQSAVMVFFVLSGLLIGKSVTRQSAQRSFTLRRYGMDRAVRIVPPLVFALALTCALAWLAPACFPSGGGGFVPPHLHAARDGFFVKPKEIAAALLFLNGFLGPTPAANASLWSLPYEVWLYVLAGLAVHWGSLTGRMLVVIVLGGLLALRSWAFVPYGAVWAAGFALCLLHNNGFDFRRARMLRLAAVALAVCAAAMAVRYVVHSRSDGPAAAVSFHYVVAWSTCFGLACAAAAAFRPHRLAPVEPALPPFTRLARFLHNSADYSYTLYVINFPLLLFCYGVFQPWVERSPLIALGIAAVAATAVAGVASFAARSVENTRTWRACLGRFAGRPS